MQEDPITQRNHAGYEQNGTKNAPNQRRNDTALRMAEAANKPR